MAKSEEAPFRVKGLTYLGNNEFYAKRIPGGVEALKGHLPPAERDFISQQFLSGSLYDLLPQVPVSRVAARLCGITHREFVRDNAAWTAERDINGIYRVLLRVASPKLVAARLPKASMHYFAFGKCEGTVEGNSLRGYQYGIPVVLADWMTWCVEGFAPVALKLAGAKNVRVERPQAPTQTGTLHEIPICDLAWEIHWS